MLSSSFGFLLVITIIVFVHEMGHYIAAKLCGVRVLEFSVGFGKSLLKIKDKSGTLWKLCLIPLGGYVKMFGDRGVASEENVALVSRLSEYEKKKTYALQPPLKRFFIASAGPLANYILAAFIIVSFYSYHGKNFIPPIAANIIENSPAEKAGLESGDKIISIDGIAINSFDQILNEISLYPHKKTNVEIERDGKKRLVPIVTGERKIKDSNGKILGKVGFIGISSGKAEYRDVNFVDAVKYTLQDIWNISAMTLTSVKQMIIGARSASELRGTLTIAQQSGESINEGISEFFIYVAMLSINIGFVNLLPIPILDGGHMVFCLYETIFRRRANKRIEAILNKVGIIIIIFLFVISTSNDIKAILF